MAIDFSDGDIVFFSNHTAVDFLEGVRAGLLVSSQEIVYEHFSNY